MSGIKQHYIPQVLLRRFSKYSDRKSAPLWAYSRERGVYQTNSRDLAAEREFYSPVQSGEVTLDDQITSYENRLAALLAAVSPTRDNGPIDGTAAAEIIVHLSVRTAHIRDIFQRVGVEAVAAVGSLFLNAEYSRKALGLDGSRDGKLQIAIRDRIAKQFPQMNERDRLKLEADLMQKARESLPALFAAQQPAILAALGDLNGKMAEASREGHVKALNNSFVPEKRLDHLAKLRWVTLNGRFVLPDCVTVALRPSGSLPYLMADWDEMDAVYMPISSSKILLGTREPSAAIQDLDFNKASSLCAGSFFVAQERDATWDTLRSNIGTVSSQTIEGHLKEASAELQNKT